MLKVKIKKNDQKFLKEIFSIICLRNPSLAWLIPIQIHLHILILTNPHKTQKSGVLFKSLYPITDQIEFEFLSFIFSSDQIQHDKFFNWKLKMLDLIHVFCRLKNTIDGKGFHAHYLLNICGNCPVPKLFGGGIYPNQVWEMFMKSF